MKVFFTADTHYNHANIIAYTARPFAKEGIHYFFDDNGNIVWKSEEIKIERCDIMNKHLIKAHNETVDPEDIVYHFGDFGFLNSEQYAEYLEKLNGHIVLFKGNHDDKNKIKCYLRKGMLEFSGKSVFGQHHPPEEIPICDFVICGHVHEKWKHKIHKKHPNTPIINVGVDVWDYKPVSVLSLLKYYGKIKSGVVDTMGNNIFSEVVKDWGNSTVDMPD